MNTGPYSSERFQGFLEENFVPVKIQCFWDNPGEFMKSFKVGWTPTLLVLNKKGEELRRMVGYVPEDDLFAHLLVGKATALFITDHYINAIESFREAIEKHPVAGSAPEAVFLLGVAEYKKGHDPKSLRKMHDTLKEKYPRSEWARRAEAYRDIPA